ncbi:hypothetical protein SAMN05421545_0667 [Pontibacter lucknowensis]|uniref:Uncharacterized protein n=1 Tax=Pontibacter lucknowensis TaxID=1077936 RepID=A0A1N6U451_9BACT|nr:hypothetical protein SAMN05421545_0667 [Pontibacter lucknowensis]
MPLDAYAQLSSPCPLRRGTFCSWQFSGIASLFQRQTTHTPRTLGTHCQVTLSHLRSRQRCQVRETTIHCLSVQRVWIVLIFLLTFFIKEKSKARLAKAKASYSIAQQLYLLNCKRCNDNCCYSWHRGQRPHHSKHKRGRSRHSIIRLTGKLLPRKNIQV